MSVPGFEPAKPQPPFLSPTFESAHPSDFNKRGTGLADKSFGVKAERANIAVFLFHAGGEYCPRTQCSNAVGRSCAGEIEAILHETEGHKEFFTFHSHCSEGADAGETTLALDYQATRS